MGLSFPNTFDGLFTRWTRERNPKDFGNVLSIWCQILLTRVSLPTLTQSALQGLFSSEYLIDMTLQVNIRVIETMY